MTFEKGADVFQISVCNVSDHGFTASRPMLAPRTTRQYRTKVPKPLRGKRKGIIGRFRVPTPVADKYQLCVAGPWLFFLRSHPYGSLGFCVAVHGHRTSRVKRTLHGE